MSEERREPRAETDCIVRIEQAAGRSIDARMISTSAHGLQLRVEFIFPRGRGIELRLHGKKVLGVVRYCICDGDEFRVGVRVKNNPEFIGTVASIIATTGISSKVAGLLGADVFPAPVRGDEQPLRSRSSCLLRGGRGGLR